MTKNAGFENHVFAIFSGCANPDALIARLQADRPDIDISTYWPVVVFSAAGMNNKSLRTLAQEFRPKAHEIMKHQPSAERAHVEFSLRSPKRR